LYKHYQGNQVEKYSIAFTYLIFVLKMEIQDMINDRDYPRHAHRSNSAQNIERGLMWKSEQQVQQFVEKKINHSMRED
jgi:hypothetical protein